MSLPLPEKRRKHEGAKHYQSGQHSAFGYPKAICGKNISRGDVGEFASSLQEVNCLSCLKRIAINLENEKRNKEKWDITK